MRHLLYYILLIVSCSCTITAQQDPAYTAVNQVIDAMEGSAWEAEGKPSYGLLLSGPSGDDAFDMRDTKKLFENDYLRGYFTKEDRQGFDRQIAASKHHSYEQAKIETKRVLPVKELFRIPRDNFWKDYEKQFGRTGYYRISFPLFSADGSKMLIAVEKCGFRGSCSAGVYIFTQRDGRWVMSKRVLSSLS